MNKAFNWPGSKKRVKNKVIQNSNSPLPPHLDGEIICMCTLHWFPASSVGGVCPISCLQTNKKRKKNYWVKKKIETKFKLTWGLTADLLVFISGILSPLPEKKFQEMTMNQKRRTRVGNWKRDIGSTRNISKYISIYMWAKVSVSFHKSFEGH